MKAVNTRSISLHVSSDIGSVSAVCTSAAKSLAVITLAHGAGAGMNHPFMLGLSQNLANAGIATLRFNFPFAENRKGRPDTPAVAHKTVACAINKAGKIFPSLPLFASGKSFGGRMTSQYISHYHGSRVVGLIFYGFPLHQAGKPSIERAEHLKEVKLPMLFLQGTKDALATLKLIESVCASLPETTIIKFEGADHSFKAGKQDLLPVLAATTAHWIRDIAV